MRMKQKPVQSYNNFLICANVCKLFFEKNVFFRFFYKKMQKKS